MRWISITVVAAAMLHALPAQGEKTGTRTPGGASGTVKRDVPEPPGPKGKPRQPIKPRQAAPRGGARRRTDSELGKRPGAGTGHVRFDISCEPPAVAPGAEGKMIVVMSFAGDAIMLDPPPVKFAVEPRQGALVVLADPKFRPAKQGGHAPALKGLPAYDDYAIFDVPFRVDADAKTGAHPLAVTMMYGLFNGKKGGELGNFTDSFETNVTVNPALADQLAGGSKPAAEVTATPEPNGAGAGEVDSTPTEPVGGKGATALPIAGPAEAAGGDVTPTPEPASSNLLLIAGGVLLVAIVLLLGLRRRG